MLQINNKPLLFIDLLGFSLFVQANEMSNVIQFYKKFLMENDLFDPKDLGLKQIILSDSMFIWSDCEDLNLNLKILGYIASSQLHNSMAKKYDSSSGYYAQIRGALCFGEFIIDNINYDIGTKSEMGNASQPWVIENFTILGKAIIESNSWEKKQDWVGISVPPDNINCMKSFAPTGYKYLIDKNLLVEWNVPLKSGTIKTVATNPLASALRHSDLIKTNMLNAEKLADSTNRQKFTNTIVFLDDLISKKTGTNTLMTYRELKKEYDNIK